ncbi:MAG: phosphoribosylamine--glycine ligase [Bacteroidota bacterium]
MKILVIGSGAREHALLWKLSQNSKHPELFCAPGNAGTAQLAKNIPVKTTALPDLLSFAKIEKIDLTVVGPEQPLMDGIVDLFEENGLNIFGPRKAAAEIEGSKVFAKHFMQKYKIPSASFRSFDLTEQNNAIDYINALSPPIVIKADGLAAGKGVSICETRGEAVQTIDAMMGKKIFGDAGTRIVIEEFLEGFETSVLVLTDGGNFVTLVPSQDHKRILDGDKGKNTGGMGVYAPVPMVSFEMLEEIKRHIIKPTLEGMAKEGRTYKGCLYAGLMITQQGPKVIEFNCRFGDPETEVVLPLLDDDLVDLMMDISAGTLSKTEARLKQLSAVSVIIASGGYPDAYETGKKILGLDTIAAIDDIIVFHAGTKTENGAVLTSGGRVLAVTALGPKDNFEETIRKAYSAVKKITFDGAYYRSDIGKKGLLR